MKSRRPCDTFAERTILRGGFLSDIIIPAQVFLLVAWAPDDGCGAFGLSPLLAAREAFRALKMAPLLTVEENVEVMRQASQVGPASRGRKGYDVTP